MFKKIFLMLTLVLTRLSICCKGQSSIITMESMNQLSVNWRVRFST
jgi:hypothetical protein